MLLYCTCGDRSVYQQFILACLTVKHCCAKSHLYICSQRVGKCFFVNREDQILITMVREGKKLFSVIRERLSTPAIREITKIISRYS